ncbi:hypothetical protein SCHPADRAFT_421578 [Schizopora paradoxa]|uniref:Uncharacterized protein n=1 Tax=Schizopora paradoxa TaxID=27342 RepID=A0A0H2RL41_9AGAM|nr:hypothetical protein SCHPADRAFT_421578 [Schizopora paradoxa]
MSIRKYCNSVPHCSPQLLLISAPCVYAFQNSFDAERQRVTCGLSISQIPSCSCQS